jgi:hypothetical protein
MGYISTINLVPNLGNDYLSNLEMVEEVAKRTNNKLQTIAFSIDDALSLVGQGLEGSTIKVWGFQDFTIGDIERLNESEFPLEYWHFRNIPPSISYISERLPKGPVPYSDRLLGNIDSVVIHHSVSWHTTWDNFTNIHNMALYHVNTKGWPGIGYHFVIAPNGEISQTNLLTTKSNHVAMENHHTVGICLGGDFRYAAPTDAQIYAAQALVNDLKVTLLHQLAIGPHKRQPDASTICPGYNIEDWMKIIAS